MNEKKSGNKNEKGGGLKTVLTVAVFILIFCADIFGEAMPAIIGIVFAIAVPIAIVYFIAKAAKKNGGGTEKKHGTAPAPRKYTAPERQYYDSDCMQASTGHDHERRLEQLDSFLKNGLIDRKEYELMLERYERMGYGK